MAHAYFELEMHETAVFELFVRRLPASRGFLLAAGLEQVIDYLEGLRFTDEDLGFLAAMGIFPAAFLKYLATVRFTGSVHAMPEGESTTAAWRSAACCTSSSVRLALAPGLAISTSGVATASLAKPWE